MSLFGVPKETDLLDTWNAMSSSTPSGHAPGATIRDAAASVLTTRPLETSLKDAATYSIEAAASAFAADQARTTAAAVATANRTSDAQDEYNRCSVDPQYTQAPGALRVLAGAIRASQTVEAAAAAAAASAAAAAVAAAAVAAEVQAATPATKKTATFAADAKAAAKTAEQQAALATRTCAASIAENKVTAEVHAKYAYADHESALQDSESTHRSANTTWMYAARYNSADAHSAAAEKAAQYALAHSSAALAASTEASEASRDTDAATAILVAANGAARAIIDADVAKQSALGARQKLLDAFVEESAARKIFDISNAIGAQAELYQNPAKLPLHTKVHTAIQNCFFKWVENASTNFDPYFVYETKGVYFGEPLPETDRAKCFVYGVIHSLLQLYSKFRDPLTTLRTPPIWKTFVTDDAITTDLNGVSEKIIGEARGDYNLDAYDNNTRGFAPDTARPFTESRMTDAKDACQSQWKTMKDAVCDIVRIGDSDTTTTPDLSALKFFSATETTEKVDCFRNAMGQYIATTKAGYVDTNPPSWIKTNLESKASIQAKAEVTRIITYLGFLGGAKYLFDSYPPP